jgi:hypothetical protein
MASSRTLPGCLLVPFLALPLAGCIETQLTVELFTQIHADGTCTRRIEYRLERVDPDKGNTRVVLRPEDDVLRLHRFPSGDPWLLREETDTGLRVVVLEALLPSASLVDGDYFRVRSPRAQPARNYVSAFVDAKHGVYEYQEVLRDPASPLAAARALSRAALKRDEAFAESFALALAGSGVVPRESDVRRAYRERLAEPFAREVAELAERPFYGPRERRELDQVYDRLDAKQKALSARLSALAPDLAAEAVDAGVEAAFNETGESLLAQLDAAGLPLATEVRQLRMHFRATLVMPVPILRANACVSGDSAVWEFDDEDLFGRGFEMKAFAATR